MANLDKIKKTMLKNKYNTNEKKYIKTAEDIIKEFYFDSVDETTLNAVDSTIAIAYEEDYPEIERCKIHTKLVDSKNLQTYVIIHLKDTPPITFCCYATFTSPPKMNGENMIGKLPH